MIYLATCKYRDTTKHFFYHNNDIIMYECDKAMDYYHNISQNTYIDSFSYNITEELNYISFADETEVLPILESIVLLKIINENGLFV